MASRLNFRRAIAEKRAWKSSATGTHQRTHTASGRRLVAPSIQPRGPRAASESKCATWQRAWLEPQQGRVNYSNEGNAGWVLRAHIPQGKQHRAAIKYCPNCDEQWSQWNRPDNWWISPIRSLRTAFSKVAQILADRMLADEPAATRRMVAFSDSRRDAALLSYEVEHSHFLDLVRNVALQMLLADQDARRRAATEPPPQA